MKLANVQISNFRSLESAELHDLSSVNVVIGRNNSGKSSVLNALSLIGRSFGGSPPTIDDVTWRDPSRSLTFNLTLRPSTAERTAAIENLSAAANLSAAESSRLVDSVFLTELRFELATVPGSPQNLQLIQTQVLAEDGQLAVVQAIDDSPQNRTVSNPSSQVVDLVKATASLRNHVGAGGFGLEHGSNAFAQAMRFQADLQNWLLNNPGLGLGLSWPQRGLADFFSRLFVLSPYRRSTPVAAVQEQYQLAADGNNLAVVLHSIQSNNRPVFERIEQFMQHALPDIGTLQSPLQAATTYVAFRLPYNDQLMRLHDMGGGIEQLLVIATLLYTTDQRFNLAIEEPETHLHPGAQRFLLERLYDDERQVIIATHSSTFINASGPKSIYRVELARGLSNVLRAAHSDELDQTLRDLGVRNSDVLLSDAVLFVEGASDADSIIALSVILGLDWTQSNIGVVHIGGGETAPAAAPVASRALESLSARAGIPHLFLLDRDERSQADVDYLAEKLPGRVRYMSRRELENYLLAPRAILATLHAKYASEKRVLEIVRLLKEDDISRLLASTADGLYPLVLAKRVRFALKELARTIAPQELVTELIPLAQRDDYANAVDELIQERIGIQVREFGIATVAGRVKSDLDEDWSDSEERLFIAPGEELLRAVFAHVGGKYAKPEDTARIARSMVREEIPSELVQLVTEIASLTIPRN